jgi:urea transport system substrate-binding protein
MAIKRDPSNLDASRRRLIQGAAALPVIGASGMAFGQPTASVNTTKLAITDTEVTVGQLHSSTGTMAISETGSIQAEQLAIDEINAMGGILGRKIKVIKEDGASDWPTFAEKSKKLLINDRCAAVFGCWTSASRKAVLPVFEKENGLLYYPTFYEGLEQSKNVFYTGQEATQQILYSLDWAQKEKKAKTFFLLPTSRIANGLII